MPSLAVVGSLNADLVATLDRLPDPGETVFARSFDRFPGGKGLNQAVAAARLGASVHMIGAVGADGAWLRTLLAEEGIDATQVAAADGPSGTALIEVDPQGMNRIVVVTGANSLVTPEQVEAALREIPELGIVLTQGEVPMAAIEAAMRVGKELGAKTILNPAPVADFPKALLARVDLLVPNEHEAAHLTGMPTEHSVDAIGAARALQERGPQCVIITRGAKGAVWANATGSGGIEPFRVTAIDTVAAGDAFCGGLATGLLEGLSNAEAMRMASAAGALAASRRGAASSLPVREDLDALLG